MLPRSHMQLSWANSSAVVLSGTAASRSRIHVDRHRPPFRPRVVPGPRLLGGGLWLENTARRRRGPLFRPRGARSMRDGLWTGDARLPRRTVARLRSAHRGQALLRRMRARRRGLPRGQMGALRSAARDARLRERLWLRLAVLRRRFLERVRRTDRDPLVLDDLRDGHRDLFRRQMAELRRAAAEAPEAQG